MAITNDWKKWKNILGKSADFGETIGLSDKTITMMAERIGTFLSNNVKPKNDEERLLKEMWDVADEKERNVLASVLVKVMDG